MDTPNVSDAALRLAELLVNDNEVDTFENLMLNRWGVDKISTDRKQ